MTASLVLRPLTAADEAEAWVAHDELAREGFDFLLDGYATEMLRQSLVVATSAGIERALVTCDDDNVASARTIERCGGVVQDRVPVDGGPPERRYWVPTG
ncbi:GNAT family N-acetyltransferase [Cellulomonas fimi]|uniref:GNAT family N-acetyltransferase n=1 Tax=Cellulomonas fimi TaxID=1708 RepID=UPI00234D5791|nr:GNAT family N-acetyltransferase [Cellulomonas fimi]MDC7120433.1 GNAT family N-acetyltransferase [Cellulomonas fimi]